jgi:YgiT-type zinc finger domain-containing protein
MKKCFYCGGDVIVRTIQHIHHWGNKFVFFDGLPAEVCTQCGETYLSPAVLKKMDAATKRPGKALKKIEVPVISFAKAVVL